MRRADPAGGPPGAASADADRDRERIRAAVYGAIDEVGRGAIAAGLRGGAGAGGPIDRAVRIAAGRGGLPDPRGGAGLRGPAEDAAAATALTVFLHYLLSAASVPSQRKVRVRGEEIDVVVPDVAAAPAAVAVCVAGEAGGARAEARAAAAAAALGLPRGRVWTAGWSRAERAAAAAAAAPPAAAAGPRGREYLASDGSLGSLVPDLAAFAASPAAAAAAAGGRRGRGRRLGLSGRAAGA